MSRVMKTLLFVGGLAIALATCNNDPHGQCGGQGYAHRVSDHGSRRDAPAYGIASANVQLGPMLQVHRAHVLH